MPRGPACGRQCVGMCVSSSLCTCGGRGDGGDHTVRHLHPTAAIVVDDCVMQPSQAVQLAGACAQAGANACGMHSVNACGLLPPTSGDFRDDGSDEGGDDGGDAAGDGCGDGRPSGGPAGIMFCRNNAGGVFKWNDHSASWILVPALLTQHREIYNCPAALLIPRLQDGGCVTE